MVSFFQIAQIFSIEYTVLFIFLYLQTILIIMLFKFSIFLLFGKATEHKVN